MKNKNRKTRVPITDEMHVILERQRLAFIAKFGREPGPDDPVFFDPRADVPQPMDGVVTEREILKAADKAGIPRDHPWIERFLG